MKSLENASCILYFILCLVRKVSGESEFCEYDVCTRISNDPIPDPCQDANDSCPDWAAEGECKANPGYMLNHCVRSCGVCKDLEGKSHSTAPTDVCQDVETPEECERLAALGECALEQDFMKENCKETCLFCIDEEGLMAGGYSQDEIIKRKRLQELNMNIQQENPGRNEIEKYHTIGQIRAMEKYAKTTCTSDNFDPEARALCKNSLPQCAYYASKGLCKSKLIFMMDNCALACRMCEALPTFQKCIGKRHPHESLLSERFMKTIIDEDDEEEYGEFSLNTYFKNLQEKDLKLQILTEANDEEPYIVQIDDVFTEEEIDEMLNLVKNTEMKNSEVSAMDNFHGSHDYVSPHRISQTAVCTNSTEAGCSDIMMEILSMISKVLDLPFDNMEFPQIDKYLKGGYYTAHHDYRIHDEYKPAGPRLLSIYLVISEAEEGGMFGFPALDFMMIKPKKGSILIFQNTDGSFEQSDDRMMKEILTVKEGTLTLMHTHLHLYNYVKAVENGCS